MGKVKPFSLKKLKKDLKKNESREFQENRAISQFKSLGTIGDRIASEGRERFDMTCDEPRNTMEARSAHPEQQVKHCRHNSAQMLNVTSCLRERRPNNRPKRQFQKAFDTDNSRAAALPLKQTLPTKSHKPTTAATATKQKTKKKSTKIT